MTSATAGTAESGDRDAISRQMTYADCAAAGMTQAEAARAMGVSRTTVSNAAKRLDLSFARYTPSPEAIEKIRAAMIGKKHSPEAIEKMRAAMIGKKHSPEAIEKIRAAKIGKKRSPEAIEKMRAAMIGKKHSPETIEKMRAAKIGKKHSPETIEKMRAAMIGKKHSPEAIEKIRAAKLGPLVALTETEMRDYTTLRKCGYTRAEALAAMGRMDLIGGDA